jgi:hypothetical protein
VTLDEVRSLLRRIETAVDGHPELTRRHAATVHEAEIVIGHHGCRARICARNMKACGRGSRKMREIWGEGETPEAAAVALIDGLAVWAIALH